MAKWIPCDKEMPKRFHNVWITRKDKVDIAYLDSDTFPRWHLLRNEKTYLYEKASAWMPIEAPKPYKEGKPS